MIVGFTGTRQGMNDFQKSQVQQFLSGLVSTEVHHGDCLGADEDFDAIAYQRGLKIVIHPPENSTHRAWCSDGEVLKPKPYIVRNHDIVDACDVLLACPSGPEVVRSGTWATIRYAKKQGKNVIIIYPSTLNSEVT